MSWKQNLARFRDSYFRIFFFFGIYLVSQRSKHILCIQLFTFQDRSFDPWRFPLRRRIVLSWSIVRCSWLAHSLKVSLEATRKSSIIQVLQALQRMPALINLLLKDSIPIDAEGPFTYAVIDLPCLRVLNTSSSIGAVTRTAVLPVHHISFPRSATLNLTCKESLFRSTFQAFFVLATRFLWTLVIQSFSLRVSYYHNTHNLEFYLWGAGQLPSLRTASQFPKFLSLKMSWM